MRTISNYSPLKHGAEGLLEIGKDPHLIAPLGVAEDMAETFGFELGENPSVEILEGLVEAVGSPEDLRINERFDWPATIAYTRIRRWNDNSGIKNAVLRSYASAERAEAKQAELVIVTGGLRHAMDARAKLVKKELSILGIAENVLLVAGNRGFSDDETDEETRGMTESDYLSNIIRPQLDKIGLGTDILPVNSQDRDEVMKSAAAWVRDRTGLSSRLVVASNPGDWPADAGSFRRAMRKKRSPYDRDGNNIFVVSHKFRSIEPEYLTREGLAQERSLATKIPRAILEFAQHIE